MYIHNHHFQIHDDIYICMGWIHQRPSKMSTVNVHIVFIQSIGRSSVDCCCTKGVTRSHNSKRTQYNGRQKKNNTNNDLINTTQKTSDWATRTPQITESELGCSGRVGSFCPTSCTHRVTIGKCINQSNMVTCQKLVDFKTISLTL
jgi:hypothetical protein